MATNKSEQPQNNNDCFIIMPISDPAESTHDHFRRVYEDIFKPACLDAGLNPIRADEISETNMIHIDILQRLLNSKMAICDLSSHNPNVLFELGIRQAFDMPTVLVQEEGTPPIFDIAPLKYCSYRKNHLYREVIEDQKKLTDFLSKTSASLEKGDIVNSIVKLLSINKASIKEDTLDNASVSYNLILSEFSQLKKEVRKVVSLNPPYDPSEDNCGKILLSLKQLSEMINNGTPTYIFKSNYSDIKKQIFHISDPDLRSILLNNLEEIKIECEKFM